jgi:hypothetical protein
MSNLDGRLEVDLGDGESINLKFTLGAAYRTIEEQGISGIIGIAEKLQEMDLAVIAALVKHSSGYAGNSLELLDKDLPLVELIEFFGQAISDRLTPKKKKPAPAKKKSKKK